MDNKIVIEIFALDDDDSIRELIEIALNKAGKTNFKIFGNHVEFFEHFNKHVHIAIVDHRLDGDITGFDVMANIKEMNPLCQVIIISGSEDPRVMKEYVRKHCFRFQFKSDRTFVQELIENVNEAYELVNDFLEMYQQKIEVFDKIINDGKKLE